MISDERTVAFAPTFTLPGGLLDQVIGLLGSGEPRQAEASLAELALATADLGDRLQVLAAFVCYAKANEEDIRSIVTAMAKIEPLLKSHEIKPWLLHRVLDGLLCALIRHLRTYKQLGAPDTYLEMLRKVFQSIHECSLQPELFRKLAAAPPHKVMKQALKFGNACLGIGLACSETMPPLGYTIILQGDHPTGKRRAEWMQEFKRLHAVDRASFMAVGSLLVVHLDSWPECALMLACLSSHAEKKAFEFELSSTLNTQPTPGANDPALFGMQTLALLYAALDAASNADWPKTTMILSGYSHMGAGPLLHPKLVKKLAKEVGKLVEASDEATKSVWWRVEDWLRLLD